MRESGRSPTGKARAALLWAVLLFAVGQLALAFFVYRRHPELSESSYSVRSRRLQERLTEGRGRPLLLVLGSSRPVLGFRPALARAAAPSKDNQPILFNFAFVGAGPVREWMILRRLLAEGVRPDWVLVEVWWPFLAQASMFNEEKAVLRSDWDWGDVPLLARFYHKRWEAADRVIEKRMTPVIHYRLGLLNHYVPFLLPADLVRDLQSANRDERDLDEWGAQPVLGGPALTAEYLRRSLELGGSIADPVGGEYHISRLSDDALHALLNECRSRGIKTALFVMPEHSGLRGCYSPRMKTTFHHYLARLRDEYRVPVIDARAWCGDEDFGDMCHLRASGAKTFSERFGRDVCHPLLEGWMPPREVLFQEDVPVTSAQLPTADTR